jgi:hypothetical protein
MAGRKCFLGLGGIDSCLHVARTADVIQVLTGGARKASQRHSDEAIVALQAKRSGADATVAGTGLEELTSRL